MKYNIQKLNNIKIFEIVDFLQLELNHSKSCNCFKGHDNKSPSLKFYSNTNTYYCYGCGIGTKPINLIMDYYELPFKEACELLENKFFGKNSYNIPHITKVIKKDDKGSFSSDTEVYEWILENSELSKKGLEYLYSRGYSLNTIRKYKIFDIENPYAFFRKLKENWGEERLYKSGLLKLKEGKYISSWWKYTIVFPYFDLDCNITYLQGRYLNNSKDELRWVNLPNISSTLYNMNILNNCKKGEKIYICEGITDALSLNQIGKKAVAVMGANNFKKEYIFILMDYEVFVVPDNDSGGEKFYKNVKEAFSKYKTVKRITFDKKYNDISEYLQGLKDAK